MHIDPNTGEIIEPPFMRTPYNYDTNAASSASALTCTDPTRTQQQFRDECNINVILERFGITGQLPVTAQQPLEGDFTNVDDYQSALEAVRTANANFMLLPSKTREKFNNDPQQFVDFCINPANIEAVRDLKLAPRPEVPVITPKENGNGDGK